MTAGISQVLSKSGLQDKELCVPRLLAILKWCVNALEMHDRINIYWTLPDLITCIDKHHEVTSDASEQRFYMWKTHRRQSQSLGYLHFVILNAKMGENENTSDAST